MRQNFIGMSKIKNTDSIYEDVYPDSHTWRMCEAKCDNFRNSRTYAKCEAREWRKCKGSLKECDVVITETCDNDVHVKMVKSLFY